MRAILLAGSLLLSAVGLSSPAVAQTPSPLANWQYSAGELLAPLAGPLPDWRVAIGGGATLMPKYEGAQRYEVGPSLILDVRYRDIAFLSTGEGLGVNLLRGKNFRAGVAVDYNLGRDQDASPHLRGLGDVDPAPELKLFAEYAILPVVLSVDLRRGLGGHDGFIGDIGAYMPVVGTENLFVFVGPAVTFADGEYMRHFFGVDRGQSARSGLPRFDAEGGLKSVSFGASAVYTFADHWFLNADASVQRLFGDAADSPVTENKSQFTVDLNIGYRF